MAEKGLHHNRLAPQYISHHDAHLPAAGQQRKVVNGKGARWHIGGLAKRVVNVELNRAGRAGGALNHRNRLRDKTRLQREIAANLQATEKQIARSSARARAGIAQAQGDFAIGPVAREGGFQALPLGFERGVVADQIAPHEATGQHAPRARQTGFGDCA